MASRSGGWTGAGLFALVVGCAGGADPGATSFVSVSGTAPPMAMTTSGDATGEPTLGGSSSESGGESETPTGTTATTAADGCGDGVVMGDEDCDDGNSIDEDACTNTCQPAVCGDGVVQDGVEACDDGNGVDDDGCSNACGGPGCGDGMVGPGEVCDDGNADDTDLCTSACQLPGCGDGFVQAGETCDEMGETAACNDDCTPALCGDGVFNATAGEVCDDANAESTDMCIACQPAKCGDGFVQAGVEGCDDGNLVGGDGCEPDCKLSLPPECLNPTMLTEAFRNVTNLAGPNGCDDPLAQTWYRFAGAAGTMMPTTPPPTSACGTSATGWLNGQHPPFGQPAVDVQICFHWTDSTCQWAEPAKVTNCGDYYVYFLKNISWGCSGRYCGTN